jgi:hypothetical protein
MLQPRRTRRERPRAIHERPRTIDLRRILLGTPRRRPLPPFLLWRLIGSKQRHRRRRCLWLLVLGASAAILGFLSYHWAWTLRAGSCGRTGRGMTAGIRRSREAADIMSVLGGHFAFDIAVISSIMSGIVPHADWLMGRHARRPPVRRHGRGARSGEHLHT